MAISYSYPLGTPKLTDTVLGVQYEEMKDPAVKNFSINDIVNLAVEEVVIPDPAYKVYTVLLTQSGTTNPVVTVLENTIGTINITRSGTGGYTITSSGLFTLNKTTFDITPIQGFIKQGTLSSINSIIFETRDNTNATSDGLLASKKLEIRVYN